MARWGARAQEQCFSVPTECKKIPAPGELSPYVGMNSIILRSTKTVYDDIQVLKPGESNFIHSFLFFNFILFMMLCIYTED